NIGQPAMRERLEGCGAGQVVILVGHNHQPASVGGRVEGRPGETEAERICACLCDSLVQLFFQIGEQRGLRGCQSARLSRQGQGAKQLKVCKTTYVEKIQRVGGVIRPGNVSVRPECGFLQIEERVGVRQSSRESSTGKREVEFRRAELQIITPLY